MPKAITFTLSLALQFCASVALAAAAAGPSPRLPNGKPDLSGHWSNPYTPDMAAKGQVLDPKTHQPLQFSRQPLPDAKASAAGAGARTLDLPIQSGA
jgi:hypothetical protein